MKALLFRLLLLCFFCIQHLAQAQYLPFPPLLGTGGVDIQHQGIAVAVSKDGLTAVTGGLFDDTGRGAVWVFTRTGNTWSQQGPKLLPNDAIYNSHNLLLFGVAVAISADGNTILIGGSSDNDQVGAGWIFVRNGNTWTQQGPKLVGTGAFGQSNIGAAVALSEDGNTALLGGHVDHGLKGAAWIFTRTGSTWTQQSPKLTGATAASIDFGRQVSLSGDGNTAIIGAEKYRNRGAAYIYKRSNNTWSLDTLISDSTISNTFQGIEVMLSGDGRTAFIAANSPPSPSIGSIGVYTHNGTSWVQEARFSPTGSINNSFAGRAVAASYNGDTLAVGGYQDNNYTGAVWIFTRSGTTWQQYTKIVPGPTNHPAEFGTAVALSGNGRTLVVGGPKEKTNGLESGKVWIFSDSVQVLPPTGIAEEAAGKVSLYPNPVQDLLTISTTGAAATRITLTDLTGRVCLQEEFEPATEHRLQLSQLPAGLYLVTVQQQEQVRHLKVLKQ